MSVACMIHGLCSALRMRGEVGRGGRRAFTLAELLVAIIIAGVLSTGAAMSLGNFFKTRNATRAYQQASSRANTAAARIAQDLASCVRHPEPRFQKLVVSNGGDPRTPRDELLVLTRTMKTARGYRDEPEGGEYEAQYRVASSDRGDALWRRFDPAFDEIIDGGGIATPIMHGAVGLSVDATDGSAWFETWDSDTQGLPHAVRIVVSARSDDGRVVTQARRVVAIDRVPLIPADVQALRAQEEEQESSGAGTQSGGTR